MSDEITTIQTMTYAMQMLTSANTIDDIKKIHDLAEMAREYAKKAKLGLASQNIAAEVKIRAERKAGEVLARMVKNEGTKGQLVGPGVIGGNTMLPPIEPPTLSELGIEKMQSHRWQLIASIPEEVFEEKIVETMNAEKEELTSASFLKIAERTANRSAQAERRERPFPDGKYQVIYADPPWEYENSGFNNSASNNYPTMPVDAICKLPVSDIVDDASVLFLWATNPLLREALMVLEAWGFEYKTNIAWVKDAGRGWGWFLKSKHELMLIGVKPGTPHPIVRPDSCFSEARNDVHSRKPEQAYEIIESMYPGKKVELFARVTRQGWDCWGNEV